jgi:hypothetical protein
MATFQIPFGFAADWRPSDREPLQVERAHALARESESVRSVTVSMPPALSRGVAEAAAREGLSAGDWLARVAARTVFGSQATEGGRSFRDVKTTFPQEA